MTTLLFVWRPKRGRPARYRMSFVDRDSAQLYQERVLEGRKEESERVVRCDDWNERPLGGAVECWMNR